MTEKQDLRAKDAEKQDLRVKDAEKQDARAKDSEKQDPRGKEGEAEEEHSVALRIRLQASLELSKNSIMKVLTIIAFVCVFLDCMLLFVSLGAIYYRIPGVDSSPVDVVADKDSNPSDSAGQSTIKSTLHVESPLVEMVDSFVGKNGVISTPLLESFVSIESPDAVLDRCVSQSQSENAISNSLICSDNILETRPNSIFDLEATATQEVTNVTSNLLHENFPGSSSIPSLAYVFSEAVTSEIIANDQFEGVNRTNVPAFFIIGDSTVDAGNNNYLLTLAKANLPPYGRDFDTHKATGRFSNGRLTVDYLASFLGLPLVPVFLSQENASTMQLGVNLASAGAGILLTSGADLGQHIPFIEQVQRMLGILDEFVSLVGENGARRLASQSIFYISIGSNDFIHYYLRNVSGVEDKFSPDDFNQILVSSVSQQIQALYNYGVRKIAVVGLGPLGCVPHYLFQEASSGGQCIDNLNIMVNDYNSALNVAVEELNRRLSGVNIIFCDINAQLQQIIQDPSSYGFETASNACCGAGRYGGWLMCIFPEMACQNANSHVWWDEFHPTQKANLLLANSMWSDADTAICYPMSIQQLAAL